MRLSRWLPLIWIVMLLVGLACATSLDMSARPTSASPGLVPTDSASPGLVPTQPPAVPEQRRLTLEWPGRLRVGDSRYIQLTLAVDEHGNLTPTAVYEGNQVVGETVLIPNVYATHNVMVEARLDMAGLLVEPRDLTSLSLRQGQMVTFRWNVQATEPGTFRGTVWLYLRFLPLDKSPESREALKALDIEIETVGFLGLDGPVSRQAGGFLLTLSGLVGAGDIVSGARWLSKRLRKGK